MTAKCNLIIDSACDLPVETFAERTFARLHLTYILDGEAHEDDFFTSMTPQEFYDLMREGKTLSTSQASPAEMEQVFRAAIATGVPTVYLSFTAALSSHYNTACNVRAMLLEEFPEAELYVVDSKLPSTPQGLMMLEAMRQREKGLTAKELAAWAEEACYFTNTLFMVEDLDTLHRGGRLPKAAAVAGTKLNVKPILTVGLEGGLGVATASRGRNKGMKYMAEFYEKNRENAGVQTQVLIGNADCPKDAEKLRDAILKINPAANVMIHNVGMVIGSHVGPGMLSLSFWGTDRRSQLSVVDRIAAAVKGK